MFISSRMRLPLGPDPQEEKIPPTATTSRCQIATVWRGSMIFNSKCIECGWGEGGWAHLHYVSTIPLTFRASEQCGFLLPSPANDNELKTAYIIRIKELYNIWNKTIRHHKTSLVSTVLFSGIFTIVICTRKMIMIVIFLVVDPITCFTLLEALQVL